MIDPLLVRLDMTVKHRAGAAAPHLVPGAMHLEPFRGGLLAAANSSRTPGIENFGAAAGERVEAGLAQDAQGFGDRVFENPARQMANLDRGEGLDLELRIECAEPAEQFEIPILA